MAGVIGATFTVGNVVLKGILKWEQSFYDNKISELQGYQTKLETELQTLEGLKAELPNFWEGEDSEKVSNQITTMIEKVRTASERVADMKVLYTEISEDIEQQQQKGLDLLGIGEEIMNSLGG